MTTSIQVPPPNPPKTTPLRELIASVLSRANKEGIIYVGDERICPGIHFCPEWDGLAIFDGSLEAAACTCRQKRLVDNPQRTAYHTSNTRRKPK